MRFGSREGEGRDASSSGFLKPRREQARAVFRRGVAQGEFTNAIDPDRAINAPIYYRLLVSGGRIDVAFVDSHAEFGFAEPLTPRLTRRTRPETRS